MHRFKERDDSFGMLSIGAVVLISIAIMVTCHLPIDSGLVIC